MRLTKGQAAIEYLTTYGWMLLVVAIVGGALYGFFQGQCLESSSGFSGSDIVVEDFGVDANGQLQVELQNANAERVNVTEITVYHEETGQMVTENGGPAISVGDTANTAVGPATTFTQTDGCNSFGMRITYDSGLGEDTQITGSLTGGFRF
jgi:hypothetical protein